MQIPHDFEYGIVTRYDRNGNAIATRFEDKGNVVFLKSKKLGYAIGSLIQFIDLEPGYNPYVCFTRNHSMVTGENARQNLVNAMISSGKGDPEQRLHDITLLIGDH